jgi:hypothetical protein
VSQKENGGGVRKRQKMLIREKGLAGRDAFRAKAQHSNIQQSAVVKQSSSTHAFLYSKIF